MAAAGKNHLLRLLWLRRSHLVHLGNDELAVTYAALVLADAGVPVTAASISAVVKAAGVTVQPFWPALFERVLKTKNLDDLILNAGAGAFLLLFFVI